MKKKKVYRSVSDIRLARERLKYEHKFYKERLLATAGNTIPSLSVSMRNLGIAIRNRFFALSILRSAARSNIFYSIIGRIFRKRKSKQKINN
jgi:hypothetical protein